MKIYLIILFFGEYSDREEWVHSAYRNEDEAKNKVNELSSLCRECFNEFKDSCFDYSILEEFHKKYPELFRDIYQSYEINISLQECELY